MTLSDITALNAAAPDRKTFWLRCLQALQVRTMAEVGVWKGEFAAAILSQCPLIEHYLMIDPWAHLDQWNKPFNVTDTEFGDVYAAAMSATDFAAGRRRVLRGRTADVAPDIADGSLDFAYIDGDHTLRGITIDMVAMWDKVRPGGVIAGDDLCANMWLHGAAFEPTLVFPFVIYFAEAKGAEIYLLRHNQFLLVKSSDGFACHDLTGQYADMSLRTQLAKGA